MKTVLNPHLVNKAVDIYATTPNVQHKDVSDELGINYKTLLKLRRMLISGRKSGILTL